MCVDFMKEVCANRVAAFKDRVKHWHNRILCSVDKPELSLVSDTVASVVRRIYSNGVFNTQRGS